VKCEVQNSLDALVIECCRKMTTVHHQHFHMAPAYVPQLRCHGHHRCYWTYIVLLAMEEEEKR
jgi:hypothetical protein